MDQEWMKDPTLSSIDIHKLEQLSALARQGSGMNQKELLPFLLAAASKSRNQNMNFSTIETQAILSVLKKNKSKEEQDRIDRLVDMFQKGKTQSSH